MYENTIRTGYVDSSKAHWVPPTTTFAHPPVVPLIGAVYVFTDALTPGAAVGGGSSIAYARWNGTSWDPTSGGHLISQQGALTSNVTMTTLGVLYDGPVTPTLIPGTWLLSANISFNTIPVTHKMVARIWNGTTVIASTEVSTNGGNYFIHLSGLATTNNDIWKVTCECSATIGALIVANPVDYSPGGNVASSIIAIRIW